MTEQWIDSQPEFNSVFREDGVACAHDLGHVDELTSRWVERMATDYGWLILDDIASTVRVYWTGAPSITADGFAKVPGRTPVIDVSECTVIDLWGLIMSSTTSAYDVKRPLSDHDTDVRSIVSMLQRVTKNRGEVFKIIGLLAMQDYLLEDVTDDILAAHVGMELPRDRAAMPDKWIAVVSAYARLVLDSAAAVGSGDAMRPLPTRNP